MSSINIQQSQLTAEIVQPQVITKLYNYAKLSKVEDPSNELEMNLSGKIQTFAASKAVVRYLSGIDENDNPKFPNLDIVVQNNNFSIDFLDPVVKTKCVSKWGGATGGSSGTPGIENELTLLLAANVTSFGNDVFRNNINITSFDEFQYFTKVSAISGYGAFQGCVNLVSITFPLNLLSIPLGCFAGCTSLKSLTFPEGFTRISDQGILNCEHLTKLDLPSTISYIGYQSLLYCTRLLTIIIRATNPLSNTYNLGGLNNSLYTIYVPDESVDLYKSTWSSYASKIHPLSEIEPVAEP